MPKDVLDEREFELVNIVGAELASNQRDLSRQMDLSLGMVNMLLRRLVSKGYIRIKQLNKRKVEYILTPKGFAEKMRKSVKYTMKTINSIGSIRNSLKDVLAEYVKQGEKKFVILGESDFAMLVDVTLKELSQNQCEITHVQHIPTDLNDAMLLVCKEQREVGIIDPKIKSVFLVEALARDYAKFENINLAMKTS